MSEILKEYDKHKKAKFSYSIKKFTRYTVVVAVVIMLGVYFGNMMFGKRSLDVMLGLANKKERLAEDVEKLKRYNAQLQKEYFELKELEPQSDKR